MEVTSSSSAWSHRPAPDLIGVSVFQRQNQFSLRFHLRTTHLDQINNPKTLGIRGSAQNGFILTPDSEAGVKPSRVAKSDLFYVMQTLTKFDLSKRERRTVRTAQDGWNPLQRHFRTERAAKPGKMTAHRRLAEIVTRICFYASARAFSHDQDPYRTFLGVLLLRKNAVPQKWRSKIHIWLGEARNILTHHNSGYAL